MTADMMQRAKAQIEGCSVIEEAPADDVAAILSVQAPKSHAGKCVIACVLEAKQVVSVFFFFSFELLFSNRSFFRQNSSFPTTSWMSPLLDQL